MRPLEWMAAIRDHPERPSSAQCFVLDRLALRLNWTDGTGRASVAQLACDSAVEPRTVRRALDWARGNPRDERFFLARTRRGHRLGDGSVVASEWLLRLPSQPDTRVLLRTSTAPQSPVEADLNRTLAASQLDSSTPPSRPKTSRPKTGAGAPLSNVCRIAGHKRWDCGYGPDSGGESTWCVCVCHNRGRRPPAPAPAGMRA
jgi:hypothetical protein